MDDPSAAPYVERKGVNNSSPYVGGIQHFLLTFPELFLKIHPLTPILPLLKMVPISLDELASNIHDIKSTSVLGSVRITVPRMLPCTLDGEIEKKKQ